MTTPARFLSIGVIALIATGCSTPPNVGWHEYYFGADDPQREAELVCIRYSDHFSDCNAAKLPTLAEATDLSGDNRCTDFTERATAMAKSWGIEKLSYVFIPGDAATDRDAHVALLVATSKGKYVVDNGTVKSPSFYRTGTLEDFIESVDGEVMEIHRSFSGAEAEKYQVPVTALDAVMPADWKLAGYQP